MRWMQPRGADLAQRRRTGPRRSSAVCMLLLAVAAVSAAQESTRAPGETAPASEANATALLQDPAAALLREAASLGDTQRVVNMIVEGHVRKVDAPNEAGWTALHLAAYGGHLETVAALLEAGANVRATDNQGHNALHFAASCRKELCTPRIDVMNALFEHDATGSQPEHTPDDGAAPEAGQEGRTRARVPGGQGEAANQHVKVELMTAVDNSGMSPLHLATARGHTRLVAEMLAHFEGSDGPSEEGGMVYQLLHAENSQGYTPLHLAAARTDQSTAALLLEWGANPLVKNKAGKTALDISPDDGEIATALRSALKAAQAKWEKATQTEAAES